MSHPGSKKYISQEKTETSFLESIKSLLLTVQNDAIAPSYCVSHCSTLNEPRGNMWVTQRALARSG